MAGSVLVATHLVSRSAGVPSAIGASTTSTSEVSRPAMARSSARWT